MQPEKSALVRCCPVCRAAPRGWEARPPVTRWRLSCPQRILNQAPARQNRAARPNELIAGAPPHGRQTHGPVGPSRAVTCSSLSSCAGRPDCLGANRLMSQTKKSPRQETRKRSYVKQTDVPLATLDDALRVPKAILDNYAGQPTTPLKLAKALDLDPKGSQIRTLCGAAIAYGLTEGGAQAAAVSITDLAKRILRPLEDGTAQRVLRAVLGLWTDTKSPGGREGRHAAARSHTGPREGALEWREGTLYPVLRMKAGKSFSSGRSVRAWVHLLPSDPGLDLFTEVQDQSWTRGQPGKLHEEECFAGRIPAPCNRPCRPSAGRGRAGRLERMRGRIRTPAAQRSL